MLPFLAYQGDFTFKKQPFKGNFVGQTIQQAVLQQPNIIAIIIIVVIFQQQQGVLVAIFIFWVNLKSIKGKHDCEFLP